jgi:hypothetical protein
LLEGGGNLLGSMSTALAKKGIASAKATPKAVLEFMI